ncbi:hypothetical protein KO505_14005 [Psychrosphaera sp. F3M07]|uniref:hypothetical protein n=1 Tax=Psychrosphaera sp. F3M07 TaxID=2841560 RepID=UPI001C09A7D1|nr:hypothetical protein [Psychrosphaera sp. F3M07]MBU2919066.1 hypothetical protein [Psychrosphaera sp. F3M07]
MFNQLFARIRRSKYSLSPLFILIGSISSVAEAAISCPAAQQLVSQVRDAQNNWSPTKYAGSSGQINAWIAEARWQALRCECEQNPNNLPNSKLEQIVNHLNQVKSSYSSLHSNYGSLQSTSLSHCASAAGKKGEVTQAPMTNQQKLLNSFNNYNKAKSFVSSAEQIASAFASQVENYSSLNQASSPQALLNEFNNNMQAISQLQSQNDTDNLNQLESTLTSTLNDLNTGNHEGALLSALSLIDQSEAKSEARRKVQAQKYRLAQQAQKQMNNFYWKSVELNNHSINQYYQRAAYAFTKEEEEYLLALVGHHQCFAESMKNNFSVHSASWSINKCTVPTEKKGIKNHFIAKDVQFIQAAERKFKQYENTGRDEFRQGAMKFAGLAANQNPKAKYYYLMGHYAGTANPLVAYSSFLTVQSMSPRFFDGEKQSDFLLAKLSIEQQFKKAIEENNQDIINSIAEGGLHHIVPVENSTGLVYAISIDQPDVVQAFLNADLANKDQAEVTKNIQEVILLAASFDAPNTLERFANMGFGVDFDVDGNTPLDTAEESHSLKSFKSISVLLGGQSKFNSSNSDTMRLIKLTNTANSNSETLVTEIFDSLTSNYAKDLAIEILLNANSTDGFFDIYGANPKLISNWAKANRLKVASVFFERVLYRNNINVYKFLSSDILSFENGLELSGNDLDLLFDIWIEKDDENSLTNEGKEEKNLMRNSGGLRNLMDIALFKRDKDLIRILYTIYPKEARQHYSNPLSTLTPDYEYSHRKQSYLYSIHNSEDTPAERRNNLEKYQIEFEILEILIFDFNHPDITFSKVIKNLVRRNQYDSNWWPYYKKLIERFIAEGMVTDLPDNFYAENFFDELEDKKERKYWKSIIKGKYDERFQEPSFWD